MACVHDVAYKLRFVVVSAKYDYGMCSWCSIKVFVVLWCQRDSEYRKYINKKWEDMTTLKCSCLFICWAADNKVLMLWTGNIITRWPGMQRLKSKKKELVCEMTTNMALPRNIMSTLKKRTQTTIKHIYNARHKLK
jgi:hypothetical protein